MHAPTKGARHSTASCASENDFKEYTVEKIDNAARRSVLKAGVVAGAALGLGSLITDDRAFASGKSNITSADIAILQFLRLAEALETDLWEQYTELVENNPGYYAAINAIDPALAQWIMDTVRDERSHYTFITAYLESIGVTPVDLSSFYTLTPPSVTGLAPTPRLTNLTGLTIDTSWYARYRTSANPDFGDEAPQIANIVNLAAIPTANGLDAGTLEQIAYTSIFHFASIEQGGASLYTQFVPKVSNLDVLRIVAGIGPTEAIHFGVFQTALGSMKGYTSPNGSVMFPNLSNNRQLSFSVMPAPCNFLKDANVLPLNSVIRPTSTKVGGAVAAATGLTNSGLFSGQSQAFFSAAVSLASAADAAIRGAVHG
jgi:hypothetical protein